MRSKGKIISWKHDQGFGFVRGDDGTRDIFVHIKEFKNSSRTPAIGDQISYKITLDGRARLHAVSVRFQEEGFFSGFRSIERKRLTAGALLAYALVLGALVYTSRLPGYAPLVVLLLSAVSYLAYRNDKRASERRQWRTPESTLHFLSLLGGWPGALIAQSRFRHKSSKVGFRIVFYISILLNLVATGYFALSGLIPH